MLAALPRCSRLLVALTVAIGAALVTAAPRATVAADAPAGATKAPPAKKTTAKKKAAKQPPPASDTVKEMVEGEDIRGFRGFCDSWMQKLRDRNTYNDAHIKWITGGPGVVGEYINYGTERTCIAREEPGKDPIGKITYREIKYRREGASEAAAKVATSTIVEQTDVTEIFRYAKGAWQY